MESAEAQSSDRLEQDEECRTEAVLNHLKSTLFQILGLYMRKHLLRLCPEEGNYHHHVYQFLILPNHVRRSLAMIDRVNDDLDLDN